MEEEKERAYIYFLSELIARIFEFTREKINPIRVSGFSPK